VKNAIGFPAIARYYWLLLVESDLTKRSIDRMLRRIAGLPLLAG
jgi:hypothetical protein